MTAFGNDRQEMGRIAALEAENEKLRKGVRKIARMKPPGGPHTSAVACANAGWSLVDRIRAEACALLKDT
jgi:hypothetical protein